jgi:hypothetical protein
MSEAIPTLKTIDNSNLISKKIHAAKIESDEDKKMTIPPVTGILLK